MRGDENEGAWNRLTTDYHHGVSTHYLKGGRGLQNLIPNWPLAARVKMLIVAKLSLEPRFLCLGARHFFTESPGVLNPFGLIDQCY